MRFFDGVIGSVMSALLPDIESALKNVEMTVKWEEGKLSDLDDRKLLTITIEVREK